MGKKGLGTPTEKLKAYRKDLEDLNKRIVLVNGLPFTGKTAQAIDYAVKDIKKGFYDKLILVRSPLQSECGFLKGGYDDKMAPYTRQASIYCERSNEGMTLDEMIAVGVCEVIEPMFLQGNRFDRCVVLVDEAQNIHKDWAFKVLTRIGEGTKFIIIGDVSKGQANRRIKIEDSLPYYLMEKLRGKPYVGIHTFYEEADILGGEMEKDLILTLMDDFC